MPAKTAKTAKTNKHPRIAEPGKPEKPQKNNKEGRQHRDDSGDRGDESDMPEASARGSDDLRIAAESRRPDTLPTYQALLDTAIEDTFPASDPIAVGGATKILEPHTTLRDARDWTLRPGSECATGVGSSMDDALAEREAGGPRLSAPCEAIVRRRLTLQATVAEAVEVPEGPCRIEQSEHRAVLRWTVDGREYTGSMPIEAYRDRLADGTLKRSCDEPRTHETPDTGTRS